MEAGSPCSQLCLPRVEFSAVWVLEAREYDMPATGSWVGRMLSLVISTANRVLGQGAGQGKEVGHD